jgi:hypothetical protein
MKIFVHGYDYPKPLATGTKGMSWLGKYFDEVKILRPGDRTAATHYMMMKFNEKMSELAAGFPGQVYYIDVRTTVHDDQWDDEIHPNDEGFREVSLKFLQRIQAALG